MTTLVTQIAPQRSTQYAQLASILAPPELILSPLNEAINTLELIPLGGQDYLKMTLNEELNERQLAEMGMMAMTSSVYEYFDQVGGQPGPFLRPLESPFEPFVPHELMMTRRYRGKTNEMFTHFMVNIARYSSAFAHRPWPTLRVCDPLAGGGTTLLAALMLGANVVGVEQNKQDVTTTVAFMRDYARQERISLKVKEERLTRLGQRWWLTIGRDDPHEFVLALGDTRQADQLIAGFKKPHLIVTDLPYGIQHREAWLDLLEDVLPVWSTMLSEGGALVFAWDATRMPRDEMIYLVESASDLAVLDDPPYNQLAHQVDRVIKQRDVIVARHAGEPL